MAKAKKADAESVAEKHGRALVDLPAYGLMSGDYGDIPASDADALSGSGLFDLNAEEQQ